MENKTQAHRRMIDIKNKYPIDAIWHRFDFEYGEAYLKKYNPGIGQFIAIRTVTEPETGIGKGIRIIMEDGTEQIQGLRHTARTPLQLFKDAARDAIKGITIDFLNSNAGQKVSAISNAPLLPGQIHVDHYDKEFNEVVMGFIAANNLTDKHFLHYVDKTETVCVFNNAKLTAAFIAYHNANTNLRLITKDENLKRPKNGQVRFTVPARMPNEVSQCEAEIERLRERYKERRSYLNKLRAGEAGELLATLRQEYFDRDREFYPYWLTEVWNAYWNKQ